VLWQQWRFRHRTSISGQFLMDSQSPVRSTIAFALACAGPDETLSRRWAWRPFQSHLICNCPAPLRDNKALRAGFGDFFVDYYLKLKQAEIDRFNSEVSDWEQREYFSLF
jgi:hypothetical protein